VWEAGREGGSDGGNAMEGVLREVRRRWKQRSIEIRERSEEKKK